jgi:hypothetical protein
VRHWADEADRLRTRCLNALLKDRTVLAESCDLMKGMAFSGSYVLHGGVGRGRKPIPENLLVAAEILETAAKLLEQRHGGTPQAKLSSPNSGGGSKRGPQPREHLRIAGIIEQHQPWKEHLEEICEALDELQIPVPKEWEGWEGRPKTWVQGLSSLGPDDGAGRSDGPGNIIKSFEYSLRHAKTVRPA